MADEELPLALVAPTDRPKTSGYPTYSTEYGSTFGYNIRARQNFVRTNYRNAYDLNPLQPKLNKLEFVVPLYRRDSHGFRNSYPERLPLQPPLPDQKYLLFPPCAPRMQYSLGKYAVPPLERDRRVPVSKYNKHPWNVPPSEHGMYRYPTRELQAQLQQEYVPQQARGQETAMAAATPAVAPLATTQVMEQSRPATQQTAAGMGSTRTGPMRTAFEVF